MEVEVIEKSMPSDVERSTTTQKRSWRFYGTFACLALLNLICAVDATILSVAIPVSPPLLRLNTC